MRLFQLLLVLTFLNVDLLAQTELNEYSLDVLHRLRIKPTPGEYSVHNVEHNGKMLTVLVNNTKGNYCFHQFGEYIITEKTCPYPALLRANREFAFYCLKPFHFFVLKYGKTAKSCKLMKDFTDPEFVKFLNKEDFSKKNIDVEDVFDLNLDKEYKFNTVIQVSDYSDGMAAYKSLSLKTKWGYVDREGNVVCKPKFKTAGKFKDKLAAVQLDNDLWGYLGVDGKMAHFAQYDDAKDYSNGYAAVKNNKGLWGYINTSGKRVVNFQFLEAGEFSEGVAPVRILSIKRVKKGKKRKNVKVIKWGYIDTTGKVVIEPKYEIAGKFKDGYAVASPEWLFGFIDKTGEYAIKPHYLEVKEFHEQKAAVMPDPSRTSHLKGKYRWGFLDGTGTKLVEYNFEDVQSFSQGLAGAMRDMRWGYIDVSGKYRIPPNFEYVTPFKNNVALVVFEGQWRYISRDGEFLFKDKDEKGEQQD